MYRDGQAPFNLGDMANPSWHTQWDWYEYPILVAAGVTIHRVDPSNFQRYPYTVPSDHSDPPAGDSPEFRKRSQVSHPDEIDKAEGNSTQLAERGAPLDCTTEVGRPVVHCFSIANMGRQSCKDCSTQLHARGPNTEVVFTNFNDNDPYVPGWCGLHVKQRQELWGGDQGEQRPDKIETQYPANPAYSILYDHQGRRRHRHWRQRWQWLDRFPCLARQPSRSNEPSAIRRADRLSAQDQQSDHFQVCGVDVEIQ